MASAEKRAQKSDLEVVSVELPAPEGWRKKFTPKQGSTPRRNEVAFISPTGEEIKYRRQLDQYLRSHPGGPPSSEFDWGTGDTPRRSARINEKPKQGDGSVSLKGRAKRRPSTEAERGSSGSQKRTKNKNNSDYVADEGVISKEVDMAEKAMENVDEKVEHIGEEVIDTEFSQPASDSVNEVSAAKKDEDSEILSVNTGKKDEEEVEENQNDTEFSPPVSDSELSAAKQEEASVLHENGAEKDEVNTNLKDDLEPEKEDEKNRNDVDKDDAVSANEKEKENEVKAYCPKENLFHNYDDDNNTRIEAFTSNW